MGLARWLRTKYRITNITGSPREEACGRPDMTVVVKNPRGRYYGGNGTIHNSEHLSVETHNGTVVAVWFRCQQLPFRQSLASVDRAAEMESVDPESLPRLIGVEIVD